MKRILLVIFKIFFLCTLAMAQLTDFNQRGIATQELKNGGLSIAHPTLPLNSRVMVANTSNGNEIEATVVGRIPISQNRIADLSPDAWLELGLEDGDEIRIFSTSPLRTQPVVLPVPAEETQLVPVETFAEEPIVERAKTEPISVAETFFMEPEPIVRIALVEPGLISGIPQTAETERVPDVVQVMQISEEPPALAQAGVSQIVEQPFTITVNNVINMSDDRSSQTTETSQQVSPGNVMYSDIIARLAALEAKIETAAVQPVAPVINVNPQMTQYAPPPIQEVQPQQIQIIPMPIQPPPVQQAQIQQPAQQPQFTTQQPIQSPPAQQAQIVPQVVQPQPVPQQQPAQPQPQVIGVPNPNNGVTYQLQVGAFSTLDAASRMYTLLGNLGFSAVMEQSGTMYRVMAVNVPAAVVNYAIQRLANAGVNQVWVRESSASR